MLSIVYARPVAQLCDIQSAFLADDDSFYIGYELQHSSIC